MDFSTFIHYLQYEKRVSPHTVEAYSIDLQQFTDYMKNCLDIHNLTDIGNTEIRTWIISLLEDDKHSARTVNRKISTLRAFFRHELKSGRITHDPMTLIRAPKFSKRLPEYVEARDMERLFDPEMFADSFEGVRDRLILEMFYDTGIRLSELRNLRKSDIDLNQQTVKVLGKRNKERIIPIGKTLTDLLTKYMGYYPKNICADNENYYIFVTADGQLLYPKAIYRIVRKYLDMVTTIDKRSPHVIRHTFATHMLNNGADLNAIKEILGHSSLAATQVYTHNSMEQLKSIYKQAHPRA